MADYTIKFPWSKREHDIPTWLARFILALQGRW